MASKLADELSLVLVLGLFILAAIVAIAAPLVALPWSNQPFPGFVVENTLVVADYGGDGWIGRTSGLAHPQRVVSIGGYPVATMSDFQAAVAAQPLDNGIPVVTVLPDGTEQTLSTTVLARFPRSDLARLFWLPYGIGLAYLLIGAWVYRLKGPTLACRAVTVLSVSVALVSMLFFDLVSTHRAAVLWTIAMATLGSAAISVSLLFPEQWAFAGRRPWLRLLPYAVTILLAAWSVGALDNLEDPWAYVGRWRASYYYAALGILVFLATMVYRWRTSDSPAVRSRSQIILVGSLMAFLPFCVWFLAPMFGELVPFNPAIFMPLLVLFPLSIAVAILRYQMWDIHYIIRRTLSYTILSILLVLAYFGLVITMQSIVVAIGGQQSALMIVVSTLAIAALFNPLRLRVQNFIDRRLYRQKYDAEQALASFAAYARDEVDIDRLAGKLADLIDNTVQPESVDLWLRK